MNETTGLLEGNQKVLFNNKHVSIDEDNRSTSSAESASISSGYSDKYANFPNRPQERLSVIIACVLLFIPITVLYSKTHAQHHRHDHIIPTLLGTRTEDGSEYINALHNPLYDEMQDAIFDENTVKSIGKNQLLLDKVSLSFHDSLTLSWEGIHVEEHQQNVIALYCPANQHDPKQFLDAATVRVPQIQSTNQNLLQTHKWFLPSFPIIREDTCEFRMWSRDKGYMFAPFQLIATSGILEIENGKDIPTTIHLALTENHDEMLVHFSTGAQKHSGDKRMVPAVLYSKDKESLKGDTVGTGTAHVDLNGLRINTGESTTYSASDMCQAPANVAEPGKFISPGLLHSVIMLDLDPDATYYYKVGLMDNNDATDLTKGAMGGVTWSAIYNFQSPLPPGTKTDIDKPLTFVVYADQGIPGFDTGDDGERVSKFTEREIKTHGIRAVHHFGDLSYAMGAGHVWDAWLDMVSIFSTTVPLMIGVGNHEYDHTGGGHDKDPSGVKTPGGYMPKWGNFGDDSGGECGVPTSKRFVMPANGNGVFWYSYDYGLVHTIMISSEHDLSPTSEQYKWLSQNLASVDRTLTPWVIIEAHRPMYMNKDEHDQLQVGNHMKTRIESLLKRYNADLFLGGHYHSYFRSCSGLYENKCRNGGLTHITIGTAGAQLDKSHSLRKSWVAYSSTEWGYGRITVANATALYFEFISDIDGSTRDSTWIYR